MKPPPVRYVATPERRSIAYQVLGDGPIDLVFHSGPLNLDILWENPAIERFMRRLASFSRLILWNRPGSGLSDPVPVDVPDLWEEWALSLLWVLDDIGVEQAALLACGEGGTSIPFLAATHPNRTRALAMVDCFASLRRSDDNPGGWPVDILERVTASWVEGWGTGENARFAAPELAEDERFRQWYGRLERLSMTRASIALIGQLTREWDTRSILPSIQAPALVISHADNVWVRPEHGRYLADHIPNATYVERPGFWRLFWLHDADWVLDAVETFFTGSKAAPNLDDRVLATVLFTDIVASTQRAAEMGDQRWHWLLDEHDAIMSREIERFRGRAVKSTGDGYLATFDGPARAIRCAFAIKEAVASLGVELRTGLHTGEVELRGDDVGGIAVHIAARVMAGAGPGEVLVSGAVPPLVTGSGLEFDDRGSHSLKGVPGEWRLYAVID